MITLPFNAAFVVFRKSLFVFKHQVLSSVLTKTHRPHLLCLSYHPYSAQAPAAHTFQISANQLSTRPATKSNMAANTHLLGASSIIRRFIIPNTDEPRKAQ